MTRKTKAYKGYSIAQIQDSIWVFAPLLMHGNISKSNISSETEFSAMCELVRLQLEKTEAPTKTAEYEVYDVEDIEKAVSQFVGQDIKIGEIDMELTYYPNDHIVDYACYLDGKYLDDETSDEETGPLKDFYYAFREPEFVFNFDTSLFKSFSIEVCNDD